MSIIIKIIKNSLLFLYYISFHYDLVREGVPDFVGLTEGVPDFVGLTEGVIDAVPDRDGVPEGVTEGVRDFVVLDVTV
jgi:hypothetical protein